MAFAKSEILNANLPYGHDVANMAKIANVFVEFALFALFALSFVFNYFACQVTLPQP
jgi:hypothetical protein